MLSAEELEANWRIAQQEAYTQFKRADNAAILAAKLRMMLGRIEFSASRHGGGFCPICDGERDHKPACELDALLK